jgi:hypothetical protein
VLKHVVPGNLSLAGNVVEAVCVVQVDPRLVVPGSNCTTPLQVSSVCAGFSDTAVIPASLCGSAGVSGKGFALIKTLTQAYAAGFPFNGGLILNDSDLQSVLPSPNDPSCNPPAPGVTPLDTLDWAPLAGEGIIAEGNNLIDLTTGCGTTQSKGVGMSLYGLGLSVNTAATGGLTGFVTGKYTALDATITGEVSESVLPAAVAPTPQQAANFTYTLQQCINTSQGAFNKGVAFYTGTANELLAADQQVAAVAPLAAPFTPDIDYPNPSGAVRVRLQNMYYTINTRLQGNSGTGSPPSPPPAPPSPSIGGTPATTAKAGNPYSFTPTAADFAGNQATLTFSIVKKPSWASFNVNTGQLSGIAVKGTYPGIVISVTDGCASKPLPAFQIRVN